MNTTGNLKYTEAYRKWFPILREYNTNSIFNDNEIQDLAKFSENFAMSGINTMSEEEERFNGLFLNAFYKLLKNYKNKLVYNFVYTDEKTPMQTISLGKIKNINDPKSYYDSLYGDLYELLSYNSVSFNSIFIAKNFKNEYEVLVRGIFTKYTDKERSDNFKETTFFNNITGVDISLQELEELTKPILNDIVNSLQEQNMDKTNENEINIDNQLKKIETINSLLQNLTVDEISSINSLNRIINIDDQFKKNKIIIKSLLQNISTDIINTILQKQNMEQNVEKTNENNNENNNVNFQECAHLEIEDVFATSENSLYDLYNLQKDIQENVYGYDFTKMQNGPLPELRKFFDWNYHAIQDELREAFNALGGMSDGIGNGVWKPWKKAYTEQAPNMTYTDMSERDKKELKMELIDIQHFLFNLMLSVGMTADELMNYYFAKNEENRNRQKRGY